MRILTAFMYTIIYALIKQIYMHMDWEWFYPGEVLLNYPFWSQVFLDIVVVSIIVGDLKTIFRNSERKVSIKKEEA